MAAAGVMLHPGREHFPTYQPAFPAFSSNQHTSSYARGRPLEMSSSTQPRRSPSPAPQHSQPRDSPMTGTAATSDKASRPLLPSISNLLGIADGERAPAATHSRFRLPSPPRHPLDARPTSHPQQLSPPLPRLDTGSRGYPQERDLGSRSAAAPPRLHFKCDSAIDLSKSPSATSFRSLPSPVDPTFKPDFHARTTDPISQTSSYSDSRLLSRSMTSSPEAHGRFLRTHSDLSIRPPPPSIGMYQQRPLPTQFPPSDIGLTIRSAPHSPTMSDNPYQHHHHYIGASSQAVFPQPQDRYLCPTCNKAFSRPSSLKIHTHSHTGEKPFRCPHRGCGKSFSVRSNMKRHERGCHSGLGGVQLP